MTSQIDTAWTVSMALLVYFMHGGFGFYEAGMCQSKNTVDTLSHNLLILAVTIVFYWMVGFGLMFGDGSGFAGFTGFMARLIGAGTAYSRLETGTVPLAASFAFALAFADTPATLIAGTGAERIRFSSVMILTMLISGVSVPYCRALDCRRRMAVKAEGACLRHGFGDGALLRWLLRSGGRFASVDF
jgi:Amt family ammonium transporter